MTVYPLSTDLQAAYRNALGIADSPSFVDTGVPITPVAIIGQANVAATAQFQKITDGTHNLDINADGSLNVVAEGVQTIATAQANTPAGTATVFTAGGSGNKIKAFILSHSVATETVNDYCEMRINGVAVARVADSSASMSKINVNVPAGQTVSVYNNNNGISQVTVVYE